MTFRHLNASWTQSKGILCDNTSSLAWRETIETNSHSVEWWTRWKKSLDQWLIDKDVERITQENGVDRMSDVYHPSVGKMSHDLRNHKVNCSLQRIAVTMVRRRTGHVMCLGHRYFMYIDERVVLVVLDGSVFTWQVSCVGTLQRWDPYYCFIVIDVPWKCTHIEIRVHYPESFTLMTTLNPNRKTQKNWLDQIRPQYFLSRVFPRLYIGCTARSNPSSLNLARCMVS
jgi:hypothetical protein